MKHVEIIPYVTSCVAFVNAIIMSTDEFQDRVKIRNEFIGTWVECWDKTIERCISYLIFMHDGVACKNMCVDLLQAGMR
mgnify:CR=1 FL=1